MLGQRCICTCGAACAMPREPQGDYPAARLPSGEHLAAMRVRVCTALPFACAREDMHSWGPKGSQGECSRRRCKADETPRGAQRAGQ